jgi:type III secretory pathway component EscV
MNWNIVHWTAYAAIIDLLLALANLFVFVFFLIISIYISSTAEPAV